MGFYDLVVVNPYTETDYTSHSKTHVNLGILSLASYIDRKGYKVKILDYRSNSDYLAHLNNFVSDNQIKILAISSTSCFSFRTLKTTVNEITLSEKTILIIGGQLVAGLGDRIFQEIPILKYACFSEGEATLLYILENYEDDFLNAPGLVYRENNKIKSNMPYTLSFEELGALNYKLYPNYQHAIPTIEESRGCPYRCNFCANRILKYKVRVKNWQNFVAEALKVYELYNVKKLFINIGCSTFGMDKQNIINLFKALIPHKDKFLIQAWTRCDTDYEEWIPYLKSLDISSVFFGMESASPEILLRMNKTSNPHEYITKSQIMINEFHKHGIKLWINFVFGYVGETANTLEQTINFIFKNKEKIGFLTGHGLIAFPGNQIFEEFSVLQKKYGISFEENDPYAKLLYHSVNPSVDFTAKQIKALAKILQKIVNSEEDFNRIFSWRFLGQEKDVSKLKDKVSYMDMHELPYACSTKKEKEIFE